MSQITKLPSSPLFVEILNAVFLIFPPKNVVFLKEIFFLDVDLVIANVFFPVFFFFFYERECDLKVLTFYSDISL